MCVAVAWKMGMLLLVLGRVLGSWQKKKKLGGKTLGKDQSRKKKAGGLLSKKRIENRE